MKKVICLLGLLSLMSCNFSTNTVCTNGSIVDVPNLEGEYLGFLGEGDFALTIKKVDMGKYQVIAHDKKEGEDPEVKNITTCKINDRLFAEEDLEGLYNLSEITFGEEEGTSYLSYMPMTFNKEILDTQNIPYQVMGEEEMFVMIVAENAGVEPSVLVSALEPTEPIYMVKIPQEK